MRLIANEENLAQAKLTMKLRVNLPFQIAVAFLAMASSAQAISVTAFNPSIWPRSDADLGVSGYVIEDFENTALAPGLKVKVESPSLGGYGPVSVLPFTYDPSLDCCGAFNASLMWDGTHGLVNRPFVPITTYANDGGWSDVSFLFEHGVSSLGFSYGQADVGILMSIDLGPGGVMVMNSASYLSPSGGRNGYLRFDAGAGETIYGIKLDNQARNHDGILYDHLAFKPVGSGAVPESNTATSGMLALALLAIAVGKIRRS